MPAKKTAASKRVAKKASTTKRTVRKTAAVKVSKKSRKKAVKSKAAGVKQNAKNNQQATGLSVRNRLSVATLSPYRFPLDVEQLSIQSARVIGLAFVLIGLIFSMVHLPGAAKHIASSVEIESMLATTGDFGGGENWTEENATTTYRTEETGVYTDQNTEQLFNEQQIELKADYKADKELVVIEVLAGLSDKVVLKAVNLATGKTINVGPANLVSLGTWRKRWNVLDQPPGEYAIFAVVHYQTYSRKTKRKNVFIDRPVVTTEETEETGLDTSSSTEGFENSTTSSSTTNGTKLATTTENTSTTTEEDFGSEEELPILYVRLSETEDIAGEVRIRAMLAGGSFIEFYIEPSLGTEPIYIGRGNKVQPGEWRFNWNTIHTPDGQYRIYAESNVDGHLITSRYRRITIKNIILENDTEGDSIEQDSHTDGSEEQEDNNTESTSDELSRETLRLQETISEITEEQTTQLLEDTGGTIHYQNRYESDIDGEETLAIRSSVRQLLNTYQRDIERELKRLASAVRQGDQNQVDYVQDRMERLRKTIIKDSYKIGAVESIALIDRELEERIATLERRVFKTEQIVKERVGDEITKDSDGDGITDFDEITIYNTNPQAADSDNDGFIDGVEILSGYNPNDSSPEALVEFESPKEAGIVREDLLEVEGIETISTDTDDAASSELVNKAVIRGRALPNSFVTLYVFSTPTIITVKTEADGSWKYTFDKELEDGEHEVYVGVTDNSGRLVAKSEPLLFVKTAEAFTPVDTEVINAAVTSSAPSQSLFSEEVILLILSISIVMVGLVLIILGLHLRNHRQEHLIAEVYPA